MNKEANLVQLFLNNFSCINVNVCRVIHLLSDEVSHRDTKRHISYFNKIKEENLKL